MKRFAATLFLLVFSWVPALAAGTIECASVGEEARVSLTIGSLPVLAVVNAFVVAEDKNLAYNHEGGEPVVVGQAFATDQGMRIDFTDPNIEAVVAEVRLISTVEGRHSATAGTLRVPDLGAWALFCTGP